MKLFISWSGERSQIFAKALHEWLPMVLQSVVPWLSHADISAGERWADTVAKELEASDFGITCVTRENVSSPWIHFEAGALAKRMQEGRVIPLLLDIDFKDVSGPLTQFQAKKADQNGILGVVKAINELSPVKVSEAQLPKQFDALWPSLEKQINEIPKTHLPAKQQRPQHEILEELVAGIRGLDSRVRDSFDEIPSLRRRRPKFHPAMIREIYDRIADEMPGSKDDPLRLLMLLSLVKNDLPWLYELGVDAYEQTTRDMPNAKLARWRVFEAIRMLRRGPLVELFENKETYIIVRELERFSSEYFAPDDEEIAKSREVPLRARVPKSRPDEGEN